VHGALSRPDGRLSLSWEKTDDRGGFRMTWREFGATRPEGEPESGFGTVMVKAVIEKQLLGRLSRQWDDEGLRIELEVPGAPQG
jgi:two-component sensor histidine kinase